MLNATLYPVSTIIRQIGRECHHTSSAPGQKYCPMVYPKPEGQCPHTHLPIQPFREPAGVHGRGKPNRKMVRCLDGRGVGRTSGALYDSTQGGTWRF